MLLTCINSPLDKQAKTRFTSNVEHKLRGKLRCRKGCSNGKLVENLKASAVKSSTRNEK